MSFGKCMLRKSEREFETSSTVCCFFDFREETFKKTDGCVRYLEFSDYYQNCPGQII